jgi:hypothetical protein
MSTGPSNFTGTPDGTGEENSTRICSKCRGRKALHHFVSYTGKRSVQRCASCRESDAALRARKKLAESSPPSSLRPNIVVGRLQQPSSTTSASSPSTQSNIAVTPFQSYSTSPTTPSLPPRIAPAGRREHREPQYLRRGQNSQDPADVAELRAERFTIQRRHRAARRHGELPSDTPDLSSMVRRRGDGGDDGDDDLSDVDRIGMISESRYGYTDSICRFSINTTAAAPVNHHCIIDIEPSLWAFHGATTRHETLTYPRA